MGRIFHRVDISRGGTFVGGNFGVELTGVEFTGHVLIVRQLW